MSGFLLDVLPWSLTGDSRQQRLYVVALALLLSGTLLAALALRTRALDVLACAVASAGVVAWLLSSGPAEGPTLFVVLPGNGVTVADVAAVPASVLVAVLSWRRLRGR